MNLRPETSMPINMATARLIISSAILCGFSIPNGQAQTRLESRSEAAFVLTGRVLAIKSVRVGFYDYYVTTIRVVFVETSASLRAGESFKIVSFNPVKKRPSHWEGVDGHKKPPRVGQRLTAYVTSKIELGGYRAIYQDWYDLEPK